MAGTLTGTPMLIVDRYILRQYVKSFLICWLSMTGLYVIVDAFSHLDEFIDFAEKSHRQLFSVVAEFYLYRTMAFFDRLSAVLAMIAAMFTVTWIQRYQELTALMAAGISRMRAARPVMAAAVIITMIAVIMREFVLPTFREQLSGDARDLVGREVEQMRTRIDHESGIIMRGQYLNPTARSIHRPNFVLPSDLDDEGLHLAAAEAYHRRREGDRPPGYLLKGVTAPVALLKMPSRSRNGKPVILSPVDHGEWLAADELFVVSHLEFEQLSTDSSWRQYMSTMELIRGLRNPGLDYGADVRVTIHSRITQPFLDVTLLFLGLPLVLRRETKNVYAAVGLCAGMTVLFLLVTMACQYLGGVLLIRPSLAAWLPLMIFVPIAVALYERVDG